MNNSTSIKHNPKGNGCPQIYKSLLLFLALALTGGGVWGQTVIFEDDFETDKGWTLTGEFERDIPQGLGGQYEEPDPNTAVSGMYVLGTDLAGLGATSGDYERNLSNREYSAISPSFNCSDYVNVVLNFQRWLNVEAPEYDHAYIDVWDGLTWYNVWENTNMVDDNSWSLISIDISQFAAGSSNVQVRFSIGTTDGSWQYSGWNIDDFEVTGLEAPNGNTVDLTYWLRADLGVTGTTPVTNWADQSGNGNDATPDPNGPDRDVLAGMNNKDVMDFDGTRELNIADDPRINAGTGYTGAERTMFIAFNTSADVNTVQYIYEQGGGVNGIGVFIKNSNIYVTAYNGNAADRITVFESVSSSTPYVLSFNWNNGDLSAKLNNVNFSNQTTAGTINSINAHTGDISIGFTDGTTRNETGASVGGGLNFIGQIAEMLYYDTSLSEVDEVEINNYLGDRYGVDVSVDYTIYYSYQTGNWNQASTWTHDPGGTTQTATDFPNSGDKVVILSGREVSLTANVDTTNLDLTIRDGGALNQSTFEFTQDLTALRGQGTHKLASVLYPTVTTNEFVLAGGGTTEYNNAADFTLPASQTEYNHLRISATGVTATQLSDIDLNGNLHIKQGTYRINDNSAARRKLTIQGDVLVDNGASISIGEGDTDGGNISGGTAPFTNYYDLNSHRIVIYGDFTNNGTVRFTNQPHPKYDAFPTNGMATVYFMGATNNTLHCNGTTDFYNLVLDKGIDQTYRLSVYSTAYQNFRLFGRNNLGGESGGANPNLRKALWIRTGTLDLKGMTIIPSLTEANDIASTPNGDFYIPVNAALHISGSEVIVLSTSDDYREVEVAYGLSGLSNIDLGILTTGGTQSFSIYGTLQVDDGYFSTRESGGIITWDVSTGNLIINGGIVDVKQYRSAGGGGGLASYSQSDGLFLLRGRFQRNPVGWSINDLKDFSENTVTTSVNTDGLDPNLGTFNINQSDNVFSMSGGTIRIYDVCGTAESEAFQVFSDDKNNSVTGGTIVIAPYEATAGAVATDFKIESTSSLHNLTIDRVTGSAKVSVNLYDLSILNNLTITKGDLDANSFDVSIGGNFTIEDGTTYTPGNNTTFFNGAGSQNFEVNTVATLALKKLKVDKPAGTTLTVTGTQALVTVQDELIIAGGTLDDGGKTIELVSSTTLASSTVTNSGVHTGTGRIKISDDDPTVINGNGSGAFGNIELNNANAVSLGANTAINGELTFSQDIPFDISTFGVTFGEDATVTHAGANRFIQSAGNAGDAGVSKVFSASSTGFTFPVGVAAYTPATISFGTNPSAFGTITIVPVGYEHPNTTNTGRSLTYFWRTKSQGFTLGSATVNHAYTYSQSDVVTVGDVTEAGYVAAAYDNTSYTWTKYSVADVAEGTNTIGGAATVLATLNYIDGEFTAGDDDATDPFGEPVVYYSRVNGLAVGSGRWDNGDNWSTDKINKHAGAAAGSFPGSTDIAIIGGLDSIFLYTEANNINRGSQNAATLKIEAGSALDIGYNPSSNFAVVMSHENGNGNFRLTTRYNSPSTFAFPAGDFSDFNQNLGTTELYTTNPNAGTTYWLPNNITSYGNLIISPLGGSNIIFGNTNVLIYGDLITRGQNSESWYCPNWRTQVYPTAPTTPVAKTITINGDFHMQGGALVWYNRNNTGAQDFVIGGDLILDSNSGIQVFTNGNNNTQSISIGGSFINNSLAPGGGVNSYRGADFTDIPLTFYGAGVEYITNDDPSDNTYTIIESLTVNKGSSPSDSLVIDITGTFTTPTNDWLTLLNGTFKYLHDDNLNITTTSEFTIPSTAGLYVNSPGNTVFLANNNSDNNDVYLNGKLTIIDGNVQVGNSGNDNNNDIEYSGGGGSEIDIQGGSLTVNGQIRRNLSTTSGILKYYQSGGAVTVNGRNANLDKAKFEVLNPGSVFNMSGGTLTIVRGGGNGTFGDLYLRPESSTVTGGEILFNPGGAGAQSFIFDANVPIWDLTINNNASVELLVSPLTTKNDLTIASGGSLDANINFDIPVTIKGNFDNSGDYFHRNNLTTFSGVAQQILGSSAIDFYDLTVHPLTSLTLSQDANVTNNLIISRGRLECQANTLYLQGDLSNNATYTDSNTGIVLNGTKNQQLISGTGTFGQLELNNSQGARLANNVTLQKDLLLTRGVFDINSKLLSLGENSDIVGSGFSSSKMITSDGVFSDVGISKVFNSSYNGTTYTYPLGTSGKYTPAVIEIINIGNTGSIRINNINDHHPGVIDEDNVLKYFWEVESTGITNFTGSFKLNYLDDDVRVTGANTEADYIAANLLLPGTSWSKVDKVDETNNEITFDFVGTNTLSGEYTAGIDAALPDNVPEFISNNSGNWSEPGNWDQVGGDDFTLTGGPNGFIVTIHEDHTIITNQDYVSAYRLAIDGRLEVVSTTFGHNLGTVSGSGTLYLESGTFPAGRFNTFLDCANNATLEYGGTSSYNVVADLFSSVPNLYFTGTGTRVLPNKDLTICNRLLINGPDLDNSVNNKKLTIEGTFERSAGAFISGTGATAIVSFAGSSEQFIGGSLGDFTGTNAFNNFEIDNSAGLTINSGGAVEVKNNLHLTTGNIVTSSANTLTITNTAINSVFPAGGSATSYVDGPLTKYINQGDNFKFPIGKGDVAGNKLTLSSIREGTIAWTAEFFTPNPTYSDLTAPLTYVNSKEYWTISASDGDKAKVGIDWDSQSDLTPLMTQNGISDMRIAGYNTTSSKWEELASSQTGSSSSGTVTTTTEIIIPTSGASNYTTACINVTKPRARLNPSGSVCGDAGIPVSFNGVDATNLNYTLVYNKGGVEQAPVTISSLPYTLPTDAIGTTYQLVSFSYNGGATTGVVDNEEITTYTVPTASNAGGEQSICGGTSATLEGNNPTIGEGVWSIASGTGGSFQDPTDPTTEFNGTNGTTYTLEWTITNGGCTSIDDVVIDFPLLPEKPDAFVLSDNIVCQGDTDVDYSVANNPSLTYTWSYNGGSGATITGSGNAIGIDYSTTATSGTVSVYTTNGCGNSDPLELPVTVNTLPAFTVTGSSENICDGDNFDLTTDFTSINTPYDIAIEMDSSPVTGSPFTNLNNDPYVYNKELLWSGPNPSNTRIFSVTVTDTNGCSTSLITPITVKVWKTPETGPQYHIPNTHGM